MTISLSNGSFSYNEKVNIFHNLNLHLEKGEILSILGPNGCGKTTLLKILIGLYSLTKGSLDLNEQKSISERKRNSYFGYVPQISDSPVSYSVSQMVLLGRSRFIGTFSKPSPNDFRTVDRILKQVKISHLAERAFSSLSGGERQLVLIARALATEARILVLDEPTSALDLINQHDTIELIRLLSHDEGLSIVFSTHDPSHALHISDKTILMNREGSSLEGKTKDMITEKNMKNLFGVDTRIMDLSMDKGFVSKAVMPVLLPYQPRTRTIVQ